MAFNGPAVSLSRWEVILWLKLGERKCLECFCTEEKMGKAAPAGNRLVW